MRWISVLFLLLQACQSVSYHPKAIALKGNRLLPYCLGESETLKGIWVALQKKEYTRAKRMIEENRLVQRNPELDFLALFLAYLQGDESKHPEVTAYLKGLPETTPELRTCKAMGYDLDEDITQAWLILQKGPHKGKKEWVESLQKKAETDALERVNEAFLQRDGEALQKLIQAYPFLEERKDVTLLEKLLQNEVLSKEELLTIPDSLRKPVLVFLATEDIPIAQYLSLLEGEEDPWLVWIYRILMRRWDLENLPAFYHQALKSKKLTRMELALLFSWWFPNLRMATESLPVVPDLLERKEFPYMAGILSFGILTLKEDGKFHGEEVVQPIDFLIGLEHLATLQQKELCGHTPQELMECGFITEDFLTRKALSSADVIAFLEEWEAP